MHRRLLVVEAVREEPLDVDINEELQRLCDRPELLGHPHDAILVERGARRRAVVAPRLGEGVDAEQPRDERGVRAAEPLDRKMAVGARRRVLDC